MLCLDVVDIKHDRLVSLLPLWMQDCRTGTDCAALIALKKSFTNGAAKLPNWDFAKNGAPCSGNTAAWSPGFVCAAGRVVGM